MLAQVSGALEQAGATEINKQRALQSPAAAASQPPQCLPAHPVPVGILAPVKEPDGQLHAEHRLPPLLLLPRLQPRWQCGEPLQQRVAPVQARPGSGGAGAGRRRRATGRPSVPVGLLWLPFLVRLPRAGLLASREVLLLVPLLLLLLSRRLLLLAVLPLLLAPLLLGLWPLLGLPCRVVNPDRNQLRQPLADLPGHRLCRSLLAKGGAAEIERRCFGIWKPMEACVCCR